MPDPSPASTHLSVGDLLVSSLLDGELREGTGVLHGIDGDGAAALLRAASRPPELVLTINAFLVRTGGMLVLIDAGAGDAMGPGAGRLADSLASVGISPDDIGLILLTHMHPDHIGGLLAADGACRFGRARVLAPAADAAVFLDAAMAERVPDAAKPVFAKARAVKAAYAGRFDTFDGPADLAPGLSPVPLHGHSPGHTGYRVAHGGQSLLIWGDVVHVPALQFGHPEIGMVFDADPAQAEQTRRATFAAAAASREPVAGMHLVHAGFAHVVAAGAGYRAEPVA